MKTKEEEELIHVRLPKDLLRRFDHWRIDQRMFRSGGIEKILREYFSKENPT